MSKYPMEGIVRIPEPGDVVVIHSSLENRYGWLGLVLYTVKHCGNTRCAVQVYDSSIVGFISDYYPENLEVIDHINISNERGYAQWLRRL